MLKCSLEAAVVGKENKIVQTLMARLLTQAGSKLHGLVSQLQQRAIQVFKKGQ